MTAAVPLSDALTAHVSFLEEAVFQVHTRWPHYRRLLDDLLALAADSRFQRVVSLERAYIFGGSLFAPLFGDRCRALDCVPTGVTPTGYQAHWTDDRRCRLARPYAQCPATALSLSDACADLVVIPNLVHHEREQTTLFREVRRVLRAGGRLYVFEALLRELHQSPHDYLRYTPWGLAAVLEPLGLEMERWAPAGSPFEAVLYCWDQAIQYLPADERAARQTWLSDTLRPELLALEARCGRNQVRPSSSFPVAFGAFFRAA